MPEGALTPCPLADIEETAMRVLLLGFGNVVRKWPRS